MNFIFVFHSVYHLYIKKTGETKENKMLLLCLLKIKKSREYLLMYVIQSFCHPL